MLNENIYITSNIIIRNNKTYYLDDKEILGLLKRGTYL